MWNCELLSASSKVMFTTECEGNGGYWQGCDWKCTNNKRRLMPTMLLKNGNRKFDKKPIVIVKN
jgi:hypothetical protein